MHSRVEAALAKHQHIRLTSVSPEIWAGWFERFLVNAGLVRPGLVLDDEVVEKYFYNFAFQLGIPLAEVKAIFEYYRNSTGCGQSVERVAEVSE